MFYSAMSAEIHGICKAVTNAQDFTKFAKILIRRIIKQGDLINT